ncbi:capsular biosynthesis protein [Asaia sp. BMEF1]|uniref:capsular polysaccharide export protein, LipB/KpsS family n=1 Tax=Asaia sp. BMEF1 TaxID=3155932 RepID=UPI003F66C23A
MEMSLAPTLLSIPPFGARLPVLGKSDCLWSEIVPRAVNRRNDPIVQIVLQEQIGGPFWAPDSPVRRRCLVCAPDNLQDAEILWAAVKARRPADDLLLVLPHTAPYWRKLRERVGIEGGAVVFLPVNPSSLLGAAQEVFTLAGIVSSLAALAALSGLTFWNVSRSGGWPDFPDPDAHGKAVALLLDKTHYQCPYTGAPSSVEAASTLLIEWRDILRQNREIAVCAGMAWWKRKRIGEFFSTADFRCPKPLFRRSAKAVLTAARMGGIAVWSTRMPRGLETAARSAQLPVYRVEDGFIRSAGLGSGMLPPASIIVDRLGVYYDPRTPSDLESILATHTLGPDLQARASRLIETIVTQAVSKYAHGGASPSLEAPKGRKVILVPGQVADDLSVLLGGVSVGGNLELLRRVRKSEPEAFIVYRPHPDVDAGHRKGAITDSVILEFADRICREGAMAPLLDAVDEVHTLTSLAGFEALMRCKPVTTYGQPFYAGWGLTRDHEPVKRRTRQLNREQLVAATLLLYPRYIDPLTHLPCGPETLISRFAISELWRPGFLMRLRRYQGVMSKMTRKGFQDVSRRLFRSRGL